MSRAAPPNIDDPYRVLGIAHNASEQQIKKAHRTLSKKYHPDKGGDAAQFRAVTDSRELLLDAARRREIDRKLRGARGATTVGGVGGSSSGGVPFPRNPFASSGGRRTGGAGPAPKPAPPPAAPPTASRARGFASAHFATQSGAASSRPFGPTPKPPPPSRSPTRKEEDKKKKTKRQKRGTREQNDPAAAGAPRNAAGDETGPQHRFSSKHPPRKENVPEPNDNSENTFHQFYTAQQNREKLRARTGMYQDFSRFNRDGWAASGRREHDPGARGEHDPAGKQRARFTKDLFSDLDEDDGRRGSGSGSDDGEEEMFGREFPSKAKASARRRGAVPKPGRDYGFGGPTFSGEEASDGEDAFDASSSSDEGPNDEFLRSFQQAKKRGGQTWEDVKLGEESKKRRKKMRAADNFGFGFSGDGGAVDEDDDREAAHPDRSPGRDTPTAGNFGTTLPKERRAPWPSPKPPFARKAPHERDPFGNGKKPKTARPAPFGTTDFRPKSDGGGTTSGAGAPKASGGNIPTAPGEFGDAGASSRKESSNNPRAVGREYLDPDLARKAVATSAGWREPAENLTGYAYSYGLEPPDPGATKLAKR